MLRCTLLPFLLASPACGAPTPQSTAAETRLFTHVELGLAFELPASWEESVEGRALVFSGPKGDIEQRSTTLTVQAKAADEQPLDEALRALLARFEGEPRFALLCREPLVLSETAALRYGVQVELDETMRLRHGLLFFTSGYLVDLAYGAPLPLFARNVAVFENAQTTLAIEPLPLADDEPFSAEPATSVGRPPEAGVAEEDTSAPGSGSTGDLW